MILRNLLPKCLAELIGTFALVFTGCGAIIVNSLYPNAHIPVSAVFGLIVAAMIYAVGHISGAHFNPAVTLAFNVARRFPGSQVFPYLIAQFGGALLACVALWYLFPQTTVFGATVTSIDIFRTFVFEVILTFFLMFVIISVATDSRAVGLMAGVAIGATVALCAAFGGPVTGASMNPARSLGPAVFQGELSLLWIYLTAPVLGAAFAALTYEWIRCESTEASPEDASGCC